MQIVSFYLQYLLRAKGEYKNGAAVHWQPSEMFTSSRLMRNTQAIDGEWDVGIYQ